MKCNKFLLTKKNQFMLDIKPIMGIFVSIKFQIHFCNNVCTFTSLITPIAGGCKILVPMNQDYFLPCKKLQTKSYPLSY